MERKIICTEDGSHTLYIPEMDEHYHSMHGAVQESKHVFIEAGYNAVAKDKLIIFEVGFGTGLNALLTLKESHINRKRVQYFSIEKYPLTPEEYSTLNYAQIQGKQYSEYFLKLHQCNWDIPVEITNNFIFTKLRGDITNFCFDQLPLFDLIYFDAFAPNKQDGLWSSRIFNQLYTNSNNNAVLVTYCAKGEVRRTMQAAGFSVQRIPGPPGKREMIKAMKSPKEK